MATTFVGTASDQDSDASQSAALEAATANAKQALGENINIGFTQYRTKIEGDTKPYLYVSTATISVEPADAPEEPTPTEQPTVEPAPEGSPAAEPEAPAEPPNTESSQTFQQVITAARPKPEVKLPTAPDWRFKISLAPRSNYFYNLSEAEAGILAPLKKTNGVIFPYTPSVGVTYKANYDTQKITHSNYNIHHYQGSSIESISVTADFTAQDIIEANYLLAVIHFFRSSTKMFYGKDKNPARGVPPPMLYMSGFGQYQFDNHPVVLESFTYTLPVDVDYINAYPNGTEVGVNGADITAFTKPGGGDTAGIIRDFINRLRSAGLKQNGTKKPDFSVKAKLSQELTRVPTKISLTLNFLPIVTRNAISNEFSLKDYANGKLLRGSQNPRAGGGIW